jgi:hypothetical protein
MVPTVSIDVGASVVSQPTTLVATLTWVPSGHDTRLPFANGPPTLA